MTKYRLPNTQNEVTDPYIESVNPSFQLGAEKVSIIIIIREKDNDQKFILIEQMDNTDAWGDVDVQAFAINQLEKYKVK